MKINRRRGVLLIALTIIITVLVVFSYSWSKQSVAALHRRQRSQLSPVIMIPGSSATVNRFDTLVAKINQTDHEQHSLLKVKVFNNGKIIYSGNIRRSDHEPFIVVGFQNNHDGYSNIQKQAKMFDEALRQLITRYNFNNFKGIGHSNGGLIYTYFLEHYFNQKRTDYSDIKIKRLMTIASPYNFAEPSNRETQMLKDFITYRKRIPSYLTMYSIAGTENYVEDGLVPLSSVESGKYIYQNQARHYTQITVTGRLAQHSELPQNREVLDLIQRYILTNRRSRNQGR